VNQLQPWGLLVGRIMLAYIFVLSGYGKIVGFAGTAGYMAKYGMPMVEVLLVATIAIELVGGLMLVVGWKARWAALAIFLFMIPTTLIFHAFWASPQDQVMMQTIQFQKNLAIMGGMLFVFFCGPGRLSLDRA
jgi:putative oxidoreductase